MSAETEKILELIGLKRHFLLSGGAGSGKTYTLVEVIQELVVKYPTAKIACITYTNAAVMVIEQRVNSNHLVVSTIHDFLWDNLKNYQAELFEAILSLGKSDEIKFPHDADINHFFDNQEEPVKEIRYMEYLNIKKGFISHDEVIKVAAYMFEHNPKICDIVASKYPYILVDEYQDTNPLVIKILLEHIAKSKNSFVCGFFGDAMQAIYTDGIGDLDKYKHTNENGGIVYEVKKQNNWRNPKSVIAIANKIRTDGIVQEPSYNVEKEDKAIFLYSYPEKNITEIRAYLQEHFLWPKDMASTKELNLTHNLIAGKAGFDTLMDIHSRNQILNYKDRIKKYIGDKAIEDDFSKKTFGEVIGILSSRCNDDTEKGNVLPTKTQQPFIDSHPQMWEEALSTPYAVMCEAYASQDQLIDTAKQSEEERSKTGSRMSALIKHLYKIENIISLYKADNIVAFLRRTSRRIIIGRDKKDIKFAIDKLVATDGKTIGEIIQIAHEEDLCIIDDKLESYKETQSFIYNQVVKVPYIEFRNLYRYREGYTPFSTQHKVKGMEFNYVLVILDNGRWNQYNFKDLFEETSDKEDIINRTRKLFYVCCTRAEQQLAVYYPKPSEKVIAKAKELFGTGNVISL